MKKIVITLLTMAVLFACSVTREVKATNANVPPGTEVPFGKISNPSFAEDYIGADVITQCAFLSSNASTAGITNKKIPDGHFVFQVTTIGEDGETNSLSRELNGILVYAPMKYSDMVFSLKRGDQLQLRGGTVVTKATLGSLYGINNRYIHFKATKIEKQ